LVDRFAYRGQVAGINDSPVSLYRHIDRWRVAGEAETLATP
jgi:hypothetical protein